MPGTDIQVVGILIRTVLLDHEHRFARANDLMPLRGAEIGQACPVEMERVLRLLLTDIQVNTDMARPSESLRFNDVRFQD